MTCNQKLSVLLNLFHLLTLIYPSLIFNLDYAEFLMQTMCANARCHEIKIIKSTLSCCSIKYERHDEE